MVNAIGKPMFSVNNEGVCDFVNAACLKALCYEENGQMLGKKMYDLIHFTDEEGNDIPVEKCGYIRRKNKDGRYMERMIYFCVRMAATLPLNTRRI